MTHDFFVIIVLKYLFTVSYNKWEYLLKLIDVFLALLAPLAGILAPLIFFEYHISFSVSSLSS